VGPVPTPVPLPAGQMKPSDRSVTGPGSAMAPSRRTSLIGVDLARTSEHVATMGRTMG
jgi:hypothetical protein